MTLIATQSPFSGIHDNDHDNVRVLARSFPPHTVYIAMASATIQASFGDATATLLVLYPHGGLTDAELKAELLVIKRWFIVFNNNGPVCPLARVCLLCRAKK